MKKEPKALSWLSFFAYIAWVQAIVATAGSLYLSEMMQLVPCVLCWYQRIALYPLVLILAVGIWKKDKNLPFFVLPMSIVGMVIALYHSLLQAGIIPESAAPCVAGISCTTKHLEWFGFVTIPVLSLVAFTAITFCMIMYVRFLKKGQIYYER